MSPEKSQNDPLPSVNRDDNGQSGDAALKNQLAANVTKHDLKNDLESKHHLENRQTAKTMRPLISNSVSSNSSSRAIVDSVTVDCSLEDRTPIDHDDPLSITKLVELYHRKLYRYAYRLSGSTADAEDLTQQTFLIAHQKLNQVRDCKKVQSWLFTVLRNSFLKQCRKTSATLEVNLEQDIDQLCQVEQPTSEIDSEQLQNILNQMPEDYRVVVVMFYFEQIAYKQIATELDIPIGTVMSRLSRAKSFLRKNLIHEND